MSSEDPNAKYVHYVIVVHGIGQQRPNETVLAVINRMAEARALDFREKNIKPGDPTPKMPEKNGFVTMGKVAAQSGTSPRESGKYNFADDTPWTQFEGIPVKRGEDVGNFNGFQSNGIDDVRFVDMYWADLLNDYFDVSGQDVGTWTDSVISRLNNTRLHQPDPITKEEKELNKQETWVLKTLEQVQETALFATKVASLPGVNGGAAVKEIMDKYVGDIQIYGENRSVRGKAVERFHWVMEKLNEAHCKAHGIELEDSFSDKISQTERYQTKDGDKGAVIPKYTIIAHSLGTVMSMDAIMYAHVKKAVAYGADTKDGASAYRNLPFEQYSVDKTQAEHDHEYGHNEAAEPAKSDTIDLKKMIQDESIGCAIGSNWIQNLEAFVTLGSPVDKYLTLWPENYNYLFGRRYDDPRDLDFESRKALDAEAVKNVFYNRKDLPKVRHYNYCDAQDPVGHHLDLFSKAPAYGMIFEIDRDRDVVFNTYKTPGIAHVKYWEDQELFRRILHQTVDNIEQDPEHDEVTGEEFTDQRHLVSTYWAVIWYSYYIPAIGAGVVLSGLFLWGWYSLKATPDPNWYGGAIACFAFALAGYLFRKVISLSIWWRQILRMKSLRSLNPGAKKIIIDEEKQSRHNVAGAIFKISLYSMSILSMILTTLFIPITVVNSKVTDWSFVYVFIGMMAGSGGLIYMLGKSSWSRNWVMQSKTSKMPEWITVFIAVLIGIGVFSILYKVPHETISSWSLGLDQFWMIPLCVLISGLTIGWVYMATSLVFIKKQLKQW